MLGPCAIAAAIGVCAFAGPACAEDYDLLLRGGRVVDGAGAPWYRADVAVRDGKIAKIGRIDPAQARRTIDATDLYVAPGFIDMMGQTAAPFLEDPQAGFNLLSQGITTINAGEGHSAAPLDDEDAKRLGWRTMREYFDRLDKAGMPMNVVQTVGHTQVRRIVLGDVARRPSSEELQKMQALVDEAMQAGAMGVSTALIYPPAVYATTDEIAALAEVAGRHGGRYYTHMRNEGDKLLEAIDEALEIGQKAGTPVHIFHLKTAGRANWPKMSQALARIQAARGAGQEVTADIYPYVNNGLGITALLHPRHSEQGAAGLAKRLEDPAIRAQMRREMEKETGWENWYRHAGANWDNVVLSAIRVPALAEHNGKSLAEIAKAAGQDPWELFFEICQARAFAMPQTMSEANKCLAMRQEFVSFCTDVGPLAPARSADHPRGYGAFPRILSRYVRELGVVSLEQAISQMTASAANAVLVRDRGRIAEGLAADLVVFDLAKVSDRATFAQPNLPSEGILYVVVNGQVVLDGGKMTTARPGRVLRGPGYKSGGTP
ncbi:MAG: D-aminoacylase [Planctomycetia bacterium]|nr:D-aminoacylase [Planctomycetia bacterium]